MKLRLHLVAALLLLVVVLPLVFITLLQGRQWYVQHQVKEKMERASLHTVFIKQDEIRWIKPGKELRIQGKLFDVKHLVVRHDGLQVTGLYDEEEEAIEALLSRQHGSSKSLFQVLLLSQMFISTNDATAFHFQPFRQGITYASLKCADLKSLPQSTPAPPPKWIKTS